MTKRVQRDLFLVLTVVGLFVSFMMIVFSAFDVAMVADDIATELKVRDWRALVYRSLRLLPSSLLLGAIVVGTFFSYRSYQRLSTLE